MKLYYSPGTCALADHIALEWIGKPFEAAAGRSGRRGRRRSTSRSIPPARCPRSMMDGWILTQNVAILNLPRRHRSPMRSSAATARRKSRAEVNRWLSFVNSDVHPHFKAFFGGADYLEDRR